MKFIKSSLNHIEFLLLDCLLELITLKLCLLNELSTLFSKFLTFDSIRICRNVVSSAFNIKHTSFVLFIYLRLILAQSHILYSKLCLYVRGFYIR